MILVTGATGMIGRALITRLRADGYSVRAHDRSPELFEKVFGSSANQDSRQPNLAPHIETAFESAVADISTMTGDDAIALCRGCSSIVHTAALVHQPQAPANLYESTNIRATQLLADAAAACGVAQFIFLSSSSVYGNRPTTMIGEAAELIADTPYSSSKIAAEEHLGRQLPAPSTVIVRPALVFGEGDRGNMNSIIRQITSGKYFIIGSGQARKSLIYSQDLAQAIVRLVRSPGNGLEIFNIANPEPVTMKQLSEAVLSADGKAPHVLSLPSWLVSLAAGAANPLLGKRSPLSADRLAKLTRENTVSVAAFVEAYGFSPQFDLREALARELAWMAETAS